jgi:hypothetical protein
MLGDQLVFGDEPLYPIKIKSIWNAISYNVGRYMGKPYVGMFST